MEIGSITFNEEPDSEKVKYLNIGYKVAIHEMTHHFLKMYKEGKFSANAIDLILYELGKQLRG